MTRLLALGLGVVIAGCDAVEFRCINGVEMECYSSRNYCTARFETPRACASNEERHGAGGSKTE